MLLAGIPVGFVDDGCSNAPDSLFGFDFKWACRIHDWDYCTRCHPPGSMTYQEKGRKDNRLKRFIQVSLPVRWRWIRYVYYTAVWWVGHFGAWDTCGPEAGELCRHNISKPEWMSGP